MNSRLSILVLAASLLSPWPLLAQQKRLSPHSTISKVINGSRMTIVYGRPYTKSPFNGKIRKIWGGLVPYGKIWRVGADEATLMITQKPIVMGGVTIPAGAHTLFMLPEEHGPSKLIINKQIGQWGLQYNASHDFARIDLKREPLDPPVHQFTMAIAKNPDGGGILKLMWEKTQFTEPFTVQQ